MGDNSNGGGNSGTGDNNGGGNDEGNGGTGSDTPGGDDISDSGNSGDNGEVTSGGAEASGDSESSNGAGGDESPAVESSEETLSTDGGAETGDGESGGAGTDAPETSDIVDNRIMAGWHVRTGSFVMPIYASGNPQDGLTTGTLTDGGDDTGKAAAPADSSGAADQTDTQSQTEIGGTNGQADTREKTVVIGNVTWQSDPAYDGSVEGTYTFTAVLPEGYTLSEGVSLPQITVTVENDITAVIQALLNRIAALPDAQEYMAKEPDIDNWEGDEDDYEEAYTEWMEGLQEYAGEALAILEEIEKLTEEEQALLPQGALEKLAAWAEIAETLSENSTMVMAAILVDSGPDWKLDKEGKLTIESDVGMNSWTEKITKSSNWRELAEKVKRVEIKPGVTFIGRERSNYAAFGHCKNLTDITIPSSVKRILTNAFEDCSSLTEINLPASIEEIGSYAFAQSGLTKIEIPDKVTNIEPGTFEGCRALTSITIPANVKTIEAGAFAYCTSFQSVEIPDSVTTIGSGAFSSCSNLSEVIFPGRNSIPKLLKNYDEGAEDTFKDCKFVTENQKGIRIPCGTRESYLNTTGWSACEPYINDEHTGLSYTADGAVVKQSCTECRTLSAAATLSVPDNADLTYTGSAIKPVRVTYSDGWAEKDSNKPGDTAITYENNINVGTATAKLTIGGKTAQINFTIKAPSYTVTLDGNGGSGGTNLTSYTYGTGATLPRDWKRTGYTFGGWYDAPGCTGTEVTSIPTNATGNKTYYAKWTANTYTIGYNLNGGALSNGKTNPTSYTVESNAFTLNNPTKTGYSFAGWSGTGLSGSNNTGVIIKKGSTGDREFTANWTANKYDITYSGLEGATLASANKPIKHTYGSSTAVGNPTKTGYTFAGWKVNNGSTAEKNLTLGATDYTAAITLTATWTANTYTVTYNGNGKTGGNTDNSSHTYDAAKALTANGYTRAHTVTFNHNYTGSTNATKTATYTFAGWNTQADGNGTSYTNSQSVKNLTETNGVTVTLYAKWTPASVTYNPTRTGYTFAGWYTDNNCSGSREDSDGIYTPTGNKTLYAKWNDATPPAKPVLQNGVTLPKDWTNTQTTIPLTLSDNVGVTKLLVKIDSGDYTEVSGFTGGSGTFPYNYNVSEGNHTYQFMAVDAAENESPESVPFRVMLDTGDPAFSEGPTVKNITADSAAITFTPSEGGKVYWIVDPAEMPADAQAVISDAQDDSRKGGVKAVTGGTSADIAVTDLTPGAVHKVYVVLEDAAGNLSAVKEAAFATLPEAPAITADDLVKDYEKERIKVPQSFGDVEVYTNPDDPSGSKIQPEADGYPVEPGTSIYIRYPEKPEGDVTVSPSAGVKIDIPDRPAAPSAKEVAVTGTTVTVKNPADDEEYILVEKESLPEGAEPDWNAADKVNENGGFTGLDPNKEYDLYVRKKATQDAFASESQKIPVRTWVTINEPQITGDGAGKDGNTAPKPEKPDEGGATVTYTGTYGEEYTPVIIVDGKEIIPGAGTPGAEGFEMTWDEEAGKGGWKYVYPVSDGAAEADITVAFRKRSVTGITAQPGSLTLSADSDANRSAAKAGEIAPLTAYLKETCSVETVYDNRTTAAVPADDAVYTVTDTFAPKGAAYHYTISVGGKTCQTTLTVTPVTASVRKPDTVMQRQKDEGYTAQEAGAWLPAQVTVTYTGTDYTTRTEELAVTWETVSLGADFGKMLDKKTINGIVGLPAWATGEGTVGIEIEFVDRNVLNDSQMRLTQAGFTYGEKKLPNPNGSVTVRDTNPSYTYLYSADGGTTWVPAESLRVSAGGYVVPGGYQVKMTYRGDSYTGVKEVSFTVAKKKLKISKGILEAESRNYDGTTDARLKEGGEAALSGMVDGDDVALGGTLEAHFREKRPKRNIPVSVTGFLLQGADAGCYELADTTLTLYATINKEDGTPPPGGGNGGGSGSSGGNNGGSGDNNGGGNNGDNSNNGNGDSNSGSNGGTKPGGNNDGTKPGDNNGGAKPGGNNDGTKPDDKNGGTKPDDKNGGTKPGGNNDGTRPGGNNGGTKPGDNSGTKPGGNNDGTKPGGNNGGTKPGDNDGGTKPGDKTGGGTGQEGDDSDPGAGETKIVPAVIEGGKIVIDSSRIGDGNNGDGKNTGDGVTGGGNSGDNADGTDNGTGVNNGTGANSANIATGNVPGMAGAGADPQNSAAAGENTMRTMFKVGEGAVIVRVVCEELELTAGVPDTVAVANAVLTAEQIQLVNGGDTIEIRVEVKDITQSVTEQDQKVIESALAQLRKEQNEITLGMYVDISMFIKVGEGEWETVSTSDESIEVVVGIPEELRSDGREYYIIRSHEGECDILTDMDDAPDTITISTDRFSSYAIAYVKADGAGADGGSKCGLCHICPTFLGICWFIWLAVIIACVIVAIIVVIQRKKNSESEGR